MDIKKEKRTVTSQKLFLDKNTASKKDDNYMGLGMCVGILIGITFGQLLFHNLATGISIGMMLGLSIGSRFKKKK